MRYRSTTGPWRVAGALLMGVLALGCGGGGAPVEPAPDTPERIIAMAPSAAELVHALGLADKVVGVGDYVQWPPEFADKPRLGGLFNPSFERIVGLRPDLAVLLTSEESLRQQLEDVGVEVLTVPSDTLGDIELAFGLIAERCDVIDRGDRLLREWRLALAPEPLAAPLKVAMVIGREPDRLGDLVVAGPGTFYDELLGRLGAINAFRDVDTRYPQIGIEEILLRGPDAILEVQPFAVPESRALALDQDWEELRRMTASAPGCVRVVSGPEVVIPGPRLPEVLARFRSVLEECLPASPAA